MFTIGNPTLQYHSILYSPNEKNVQLQVRLSLFANNSLLPSGLRSFRSGSVSVQFHGSLIRYSMSHRPTEQTPFRSGTGETETAF